jgi:hypothetical protein
MLVSADALDQIRLDHATDYQVIATHLEVDATVDQISDSHRITSCWSSS